MSAAKASSAAMDASQLQAQTSLNIFRAFMKQNADGSIESRGVISAECYKTWLRSRKTLPSCPEKAFQRALSGHLTGVDGRVPFDEEEEESILKVLRRKARWECFRHCDVKFGESGFRAKGFHEKAITGEILKSKPKKRAKRAIERLRKMSRLGTTPGGDDLLSVSNEDSLDGSDAEEEEEDTSTATTHEDNETDSVGSSYPSKRLKGSDNATSIYPSGEKSCMSALNMQIPRFVQTPMPPAALSMLTMMVNTASQLAASGTNSYGAGILSLERTIMLSRGWFGSPDVNTCRSLMAELTARYPGESITFHDYTSKDYADRILLQNETSIEVFGGISRFHGGFKGFRTHPEEIWRFLKAFAEVATAPNGTEVSLRVRMVTKSKGDRAMFDGSYTIDDANKLIIERGRIVDEPPSSSVAANNLFGNLASLAASRPSLPVTNQSPVFSSTVSTSAQQQNSLHQAMSALLSFGGGNSDSTSMGPPPTLSASSSASSASSTSLNRWN